MGGMPKSVPTLHGVGSLNRISQRGLQWGCAYRLTHDSRQSVPFVTIRCPVLSGLG